MPGKPTEMQCDNRVLKKLIILCCCTTLVVFIVHIDDNTENYSTKKILQVSETVTQYTQPTGPLWMKNMSLIMDQRRRDLERKCEMLGLNTPGNDSLHKPNAWEFLINHEHHLVWCNVFKAASTSWMYNFNVLAGYSPHFLQASRQVPLQLARRKYPRPSLDHLLKALNVSTSFLIVRHPLSRLLSAYRDKIEFAIPNSYHYKLGSDIVNKYRDLNGKILQKRPLFSEFVQYLFDLYKNNGTFDMHWTPITNFCTPCQIRFDIIMKVETLQADQNYLIQKTNLQKWIKPEWKNPSKGTVNHTRLKEQYYSQLTKRQIQKLYHIYRYDFHLFDYSLEGYLKYGTSS
ncbi:UNVERIFIED_CONTAM: hypothetical protein PYX00_000059 [Menopon gallinae]|uniref:Carbohydrate sulfotransferase n=1 Tax=Menopon gallinae TaxID=328185 RepID=A0AAW2I8P2_9NEOP